MIIIIFYRYIYPYRGLGDPGSDRQTDMFFFNFFFVLFELGWGQNGIARGCMHDDGVHGDPMARMYVCHDKKPMVDAHEGPVTGQKMAFFENL